MTHVRWDALPPAGGVAPVEAITAAPTRMVENARGAANPSRLVVNRSMQTSSAWALLAIAGLLVPLPLISSQPRLRLRSAHKGLEPSVSGVHEPSSLMIPCPAPTLITKSADDPGCLDAI